MRTLISRVRLLHKVWAPASTSPRGLFWTCGHGTTSQLHYRHKTGHRRVDILRTMHTGGWCCLRIRAFYLLHAAVPLSTLPGRAHLRSADNGQYDVRRTTGVIVGRFNSSLRCESACLESAIPIGLFLHQIDCVETFKSHLKTNSLWARTVYHNN